MLCRCTYAQSFQGRESARGGKRCAAMSRQIVVAQPGRQVALNESFELADVICIQVDHTRALLPRRLDWARPRPQASRTLAQTHWRERANDSYDPPGPSRGGRSTAE